VVNCRGGLVLEKFKKWLKKTKNSEKPINDYVNSSVRKREGEIDHKQASNKQYLITIKGFKMKMRKN
jgi:hypothetical protein